MFPYDAHSHTSASLIAAYETAMGARAVYSGWGLHGSRKSACLAGMKLAQMAGAVVAAESDLRRESCGVGQSGRVLTL